MLGDMTVERSTRWFMPGWVALAIINLTGLAFATSMLLVGAAIDTVFFSG